MKTPEKKSYPNTMDSSLWESLVKRVPRIWIIRIVVFIITFMATCGFLKALEVIGHPPNESVFTYLGGILSAVLGIVLEHSLSRGGQKSKHVLNWETILGCIVAAILGVLMMWTSPTTENSSKTAVIITSDSVSSKNDDLSSNQNSTSSKAVVQHEPYMSLQELKSDPYLLNLDKYAGHHVDENQMEEMAYILIGQAISEISVKGPYPAESLNSAESEYAQYTQQANEYECGYNIFVEQAILKDYQELLLKDAISYRELANNIFQVCDNQKILANLHLKLGSLYEEIGDTNQAFLEFNAAFGWFEEAYCTGISEGVSSEIKKDIVTQLEYAGAKLTNLRMDQAEQTMAPVIVAVYKRLSVQ